MADPDAVQEDLLEHWRPFRQRGVIFYWITTRQTVVGTEMNTDKFVWEVWTLDKSRKIGQSADGQTYSRRQYASQGAERFIKGLIEE